MRIGLYGGSFDPPHCAHWSLARTALDHLGLDELRWLPAGQPWQKAGRRLAAAEHRAAMVQALIAGEPRFVLDRSDLDRPGPSYSIDTVRALQARRPDAALFLVIGQDQFDRIATWREWQELLARVTLAVAGRGAERVAAPAAVRGLPHRVEALPMPPSDVSSSTIRAHLACGGAAAALAPAMVAPEVARYIDQHGLYRPTPPSTASMEPDRN